MDVVFIHADTQVPIVTVNALNIIPGVMDLVVLPNGELFRVMQRAFIMEAAQNRQTRLVDLSAPSQHIGITVQLAVLPVEVALQDSGVLQ